MLTLENATTFELDISVRQRIEISYCSPQKQWFIHAKHPFIAGISGLEARQSFGKVGFHSKEAAIHWLKDNGWSVPEDSDVKN